MRVYVASTYLELGHFREAAERVTLKLGHASFFGFALDAAPAAHACKLSCAPARSRIPVQIA